MNDDRGDKTLVAKVAEALVGRLLDKNKKVQVAVCSSLGVFVESTGELMVPYLEPVYRALVESMKVYRTRSLMVMFDTLGVMADYIGPAIGKGSLPSVYVPALLQLWNNMASSNPFDRALLPLMECLGSITVACGMNFQPWALEAFENSMSMIEACNLVIAHEESLAEDDELADPIICSVDLMDGLVEALGGNFVSLVNGSSKFGQAFANVLVGLSEHDVPGVRMSLFALLGDLAKNAPSLIESGLPQLLSEAILSIDPMHSAMCNNAIWAVGELNRQSMV
jgi:transportin-1